MLFIVHTEQELKRFGYLFKKGGYNIHLDEDRCNSSVLALSGKVQGL